MSDPVEAWARTAVASWPKAWAIDNIPSLPDPKPYESIEVEVRPNVCLAGFGPLSNGIPRLIGDGGASERRMPPPIGKRVRLLDEDITKRMRKP